VIGRTYRPKPGWSRMARLLLLLLTIANASQPAPVLVGVARNLGRRRPQCLHRPHPLAQSLVLHVS
jgi:hypothetical protein